VFRFSIFGSGVSGSQGAGKHRLPVFSEQALLDSGFRILGFGFRGRDSGFRIPGFWFLVSGQAHRFPVFSEQALSDSGLRVPGFGFQISGSGVRGSCEAHRFPVFSEHAPLEADAP